MRAAGRHAVRRVAAGLLASAWLLGSSTTGAAAPARTLDGDWQGACDRRGAPVRADLFITRDRVTFNRRLVKAVVRRNDAIHFGIDDKKRPVVFNGRLTKDGAMIRGVLAAPGQAVNCSFGRRSRSMLYGGFGLPPERR